MSVLVENSNSLIRAMGTDGRPSGGMVTRFALSSACRMAEGLAGEESLYLEFGVDTLEDFLTVPVEMRDTLARRVQDQAVTLAAVEGGATGAAGLIGVALDVPGLTVLSLRTIYRIALCYGIRLYGAAGREAALAVLAKAGGQALSEKEAALTALAAMRRSSGTSGLSRVVSLAVGQATGQRVLAPALQAVAMQLGSRLPAKRLLSAVPVFGGALGASVNAAFVREVCMAARKEFAPPNLNSALLQNTPAGAVVKATGLE